MNTAICQRRGRLSVSISDMDRILSGGAGVAVRGLLREAGEGLGDAQQFVHQTRRQPLPSPLWGRVRDGGRGRRCVASCTTPTSYSSPQGGGEWPASRARQLSLCVALTRRFSRLLCRLVPAVEPSLQLLGGLFRRQGAVEDVGRSPPGLV